MPRVRIHEASIHAGVRRVLPLSGEAHYWRLAPARWRAVLSQMKRLGLGMVGTYVPWQYHELAPGEFDFDGRVDPQRNLVGFLSLCAELDLDVFIRPGPYIYAEWTNAGVPDRVVGLHRLSDAYRREAEVWMRAATAAVRPFFATDHSRFPAGGPIVLFQPDNEMDLFSHWFEGEVGVDGPAADDAPFVRFIRERYRNVAELNLTWGADYSRLQDARPYASRVTADAPDLRRTRDYWLFQHWAVAAAVRWHADTYRALGVDLPMVANYYPGGDVQNWRALADHGGVDMLGIDWYPRNEFAGPPPPQGTSAGEASGGGGIFGLPPRREHRVFLDSCRYQSAVSVLPYIAEAQCGVWHGYHNYTGAPGPNHYRLLFCSALLAGIKGLNWYMFAGRDNWYFSPVNERGEPRPELSEVFLNLHRIYREIDVPALFRLARTAVYFEALHIGTNDALATNPTLQSLYDARIDYSIQDHRTLDSLPSDTLLFYAAADWLSREAQSQLVSFVERGGTLVLGRQRPCRDDDFEPLDALGIPAPDRVLSHLGKKVELDLAAFGAPATAIAEGGIWVWDTPPGTPLIATQIAGRQQAVENADKWMAAYIGKRWNAGFVVRRGRGRIVMLGVPVNPDLCRALHYAAATPIPVMPDSDGVQAAALACTGDAAKRLVLAATNIGGQPVRSRLTLDIPDLGEHVRITDLWTGLAEVFPRDRAEIFLDRASGSVFRLEKV